MKHDPMDAYEAYRLQWMIDHGYTLPRLVRELARMQEEFPDLGLEDLWEEWKQEYGFNGEIWASYTEWLNNEGKEA